jgi:hypothetical protein
VELRLLHKNLFVQDVAKKPRWVGRHVLIAAKDSIVFQFLSSLNKTLFMNRDTGIITAATPGVSSEVIRGNTRGEKDFSVIYSRPEYPTLSLMIIELRKPSGQGVLEQ